MKAVIDLDQLCSDSELIAGLSYRSLEEVLDAQRVPDFTQVLVAAFKSE